MDQGGRSIPAGDQLHIVERIRLLKDVDKLEIAYTMTDPEHWEGEWKSTKRFVRVNDIDVGEVVCTPDLNRAPEEHAVEGVREIESIAIQGSRAR